MIAALRSGWQRALAIAERRLPALTRLRQPEALPIELHRRRIYVLPTRFGFVFGGITFIMALGSLNYGNNPALLLTALLAAVAFLSVLVGFRNLDGLTLRAIHAAPCFAGEPLRVELIFDADARTREALRIDVGDRHACFATDAGIPTRVAIEMPTQRRGLLRLPRVRLWTTWPYGLFGPWSWLSPMVDLLVYPRPETPATALPETPRQSAQWQARSTSDEFGSLRSYRPSDPMRMIAWKASAKHDRLLVREPDTGVGKELVLDYTSLHGLDIEARVSRLARWVCDAEAARRAYVLRVPGRTLGPALGSEHYHACLRELALL